VPGVSAGGGLPAADLWTHWQACGEVRESVRTSVLHFGNIFGGGIPLLIFFLFSFFDFSKIFILNNLPDGDGAHSPNLGRNSS
jgi:hypothetical protein